MGKLLLVTGLFFVLQIQSVHAQDSSFFLIGPSFGINQSWLSYDKPIYAFRTNQSYGFEGGLNVFHKTKRKFGFLGTLGYLQTESSNTACEYSSSTTIRMNEASKWLTAEATALFFPLPKCRTLPFFGAGLSAEFLQRADVSLRKTISPYSQTKMVMNLEDFRNKRNYHLKVTAGMTIDQFDKHRIVLLAGYSHALQSYSRSPNEDSIFQNPLDKYINPQLTGNSFVVNTFTVKLMMAL